MAKQVKDQIVYVKNESGAVNAIPRHLYEMLKKEPTSKLELVSAPKAKKSSEPTE